MHMKHVLSSGLNLWQKISLQSALNLVLPMMISQLCPNHAYSQCIGIMVIFGFYRRYLQNSLWFPTSISCISSKLTQPNIYDI